MKIIAQKTNNGTDNDKISFGITKSDKESMKSDDLLKRVFQAEKPCEKCVTDITEIKCRNGKLYVSAIFACYDLSVLGLAMTDNMKAELCVETVRNTVRTRSDLRNAILHSDRGSQYTSDKYRSTLAKFVIIQIMSMLCAVLWRS